MNESSFAKLRYRLFWTGKPVNMDKIDNAYRAAVRIVKENMNDWKLHVEVLYHEKEGAA